MSNIKNEDHLIKDFYSKYRIRYKSELEIFHKENPEVANLLYIINIMEFDGKVAKALSNMHNRINENDVKLDPNFRLISINAIINYIRSTTECLKKINSIFFIEKHVSSIGTVRINENDVKLDPNFRLISINAIINYIRSTTECLKKINSIFFIEKHVSSIGTVRIFDIAIKLGYNEQDSEKLRMLSFHDIRNALSHIDYRYVYNDDDSFKSIIWMDQKHNPHEASYDELFEIAKKTDYLSKMYQELYREYFLQAS